VNAVGRRSSRRSGGATSNALSSRARSRWPHRLLPAAVDPEVRSNPMRSVNWVGDEYGKYWKSLMWLFLENTITIVIILCEEWKGPCAFTSIILSTEFIPVSHLFAYRRFVTFYISALEILLLTYLLIYEGLRRFAPRVQPGLRPWTHAGDFRPPKLPQLCHPNLCLPCRRQYRQFSTGARVFTSFTMSVCWSVGVTACVLPPGYHNVQCNRHHCLHYVFIAADWNQRTWNEGEL